MNIKENTFEMLIVVVLSILLLTNQTHGDDDPVIIVVTKDPNGYHETEKMPATSRSASTIVIHSNDRASNHSIPVNVFYPTTTEFVSTITSKGATISDRGKDVSGKYGPTWRPTFSDQPRTSSSSKVPTISDGATEADLNENGEKVITVKPSTKGPFTSKPHTIKDGTSNPIASTVGMDTGSSYHTISDKGSGEVVTDRAGKVLTVKPTSSTGVTPIDKGSTNSLPGISTASTLRTSTNTKSNTISDKGTGVEVTDSAGKVITVIAVSSTQVPQPDVNTISDTGGKVTDNQGKVVTVSTAKPADGTTSFPIKVTTVLGKSTTKIEDKSSTEKPKITSEPNKLTTKTNKEALSTSASLPVTTKPTSATKSNLPVTESVIETSNAALETRTKGLTTQPSSVIATNTNTVTTSTKAIPSNVSKNTKSSIKPTDSSVKSTTGESKSVTRSGSTTKTQKVSSHDLSTSEVTLTKVVPTTTATKTFTERLTTTMLPLTTLMPKSVTSQLPPWCWRDEYGRVICKKKCGTKKPKKKKNSSSESNESKKVWKPKKPCNNKKNNKEVIDISNKGKGRAVIGIIIEHRQHSNKKSKCKIILILTEGYQSYHNQKK